MKTIAAIALFAGVAIILLVRRYRKKHPELPGDASVGHAMLQLAGGALAVLGLIALLAGCAAPSENARAAEAEAPDAGAPQAVEGTRFYLVLHCDRPAFVMWAGPRSAGSLRFSSMNRSTLAEIAKLRDQASANGQYYVVRARGPRCEDT